VRVRLLVVAAFLGMAAVPVLLAWNSGFLPGPQQASAESTGPSTTSSVAVTPLAWPDEPLGLAASETQVVWEQRDRSAEIAGIWYYDTRTGETQRMLGRTATGKSSGFPAASGDLVVWASWAGKRGAGPPAIQALDMGSTRRWQVAAAGREPAAAGELVLWVEPDGDGRGGDVIHGVNALTDAEYAVIPGGRVYDLAASGSWAAWISGSGSTREVWAGSFQGSMRYRLASRGAAVAMDRDRIVWAAAVGRHATSLVSWDRRAKRSTVLCHLPGAGTSLSLGRRTAVWVMTRKSTGPKVWAYDFELGKAYEVSSSGGRQVSPVIVAGSVYWADDRSGHWELYSRSLQH
jgi:hypothetical protein